MPREKSERGAPPEERRRVRVDPRAAAAEAGIIALLGTALAACSLALLVFGYEGTLRFGAADLITAGAAGLAAAAVVRVNVRLHRRWKERIGRFTAAAALCAVAAVAGALAVMVPGECPGELFSTGRCGVKEAAAWGQVAGLAAVVNFGLAGMTLGIYRAVRGVLRDASDQGADGVRALRDGLRRRTGRGTPARRHDPRAPKGRPTPRRADAERARRERLRTRA
ncbi:hypothetical protein GCM10023085_65440 [Actinomadura viridis]|uniref:Uncharacterized protein n=1 Tax=Actinomadura viridis TaxID=58110 RepID=A0A931DN70_9ACTN|nr:hypothetical protein [Actinomadura viridis]MBG6093040.1 hypothetical protein [Actinomadura viridis]